MNFLPKHFGKQMMRVESSIYNLADNIIVGYTGGYWEYAEADPTEEIDCEGAFAYLDENELTIRNIFSGSKTTVDGVLAGMIITIYAINLVMERTGSDDLYDIWHRLRVLAYDYAKETDQTDAAFMMLD